VGILFATTSNRLRVLIVEDCADAASSTAVLLGLWGHEPRVARDGKAALAEAADFRPDVVLLDLGLPDMDGAEVAKRLKAAGAPFIVAITGYNRAPSPDIDVQFLKPVDPRRLEGFLDRFGRAVAC